MQLSPFLHAPAFSLYLSLSVSLRGAPAHSVDLCCRRTYKYKSESENVKLFRPVPGPPRW